MADLMVWAPFPLALLAVFGLIRVIGFGVDLLRGRF